MNPRILGLLATFSLALGVTSPAAAQFSGSNADCRSNPHLPRARELYEDLQFDEAATTLQRAIEYADNCRWDLGEVYRLKGFVEAVNGQRERCHRDFEIFLALNPDYEMPTDVPSKIRRCFEDAENVPPSRRELGVEHDVPQRIQPNAPVAIKVQVIDPLRLVDQVKVFFRREGVKIFTEVSARADDSVSVVIPALAVSPDPKGYRMEYVVRAVDRWGGVLAEEGSPRRPLRFAVQPGTAGGESIVEKWWFWTAVAVGAVAIGLLGTQIVASDANDVGLTIKVVDR